VLLRLVQVTSNECIFLKPSSRLALILCLCVAWTQHLLYLLSLLVIASIQSSNRLIHLSNWYGALSKAMMYAHCISLEAFEVNVNFKLV